LLLNIVTWYESPGRKRTGSCFATKSSYLKMAAISAAEVGASVVARMSALSMGFE
jgi:hypothetical protein